MRGPAWRMLGALGVWASAPAAAQLPAPCAAAPPADHAASAPAAPGVLTLDAAIALACRDSLPAVLARLRVEDAEVQRVAAGLWENPELGYTMANMVMGRGFDQDQGLDPATFEQLQHTIELKGPVDVWFKRAARRRAALAGIEQARHELADALREVRRAVSEDFAKVVRHQGELELAAQSRARYRQTLEICRRRRAAGDISQAELEKIELEELRYIEAEQDATLALGQARLALAERLGMADPAALPAPLSLPLPQAEGLDGASLRARAAERRPDLLAQAQAAEAARLALVSARRDALPDVSLQVAYIESRFQASGDNPHSLGVGLSLPLPLFDRNQAEVAGARVEVARAERSLTALRRQVGLEVGAAELAWRQASLRLATLEGDMLARAQRAQALAARAWQTGFTSLLDFLEADRTYLELQLAVVQAQDDVRQAAFGLHWAVGGAW